MMNKYATLPRKRCGGFTYLEMAIASGMIAGLVAIAIYYLAGLRVDAERTALESTVGSLRSALGIKVAEFISKGDVAGIRTLEGSNPMERLAERPKTYVGVLAGADRDRVAGGRWYFDANERVLVYRVINAANFAGGAGPPARARFQVKLLFKDANSDGAYDQAVDELEGVRLAVLEPYRWTE